MPSEVPAFNVVTLNGYTAIDLGSLGGTFNIANDINEVGQIVGISSLSTGERRAFLWEDGVMEDLGTLGGTEAYAFGINNAGQVSGYSRLSNGTRHAFLWENGTMHDLGAIGSESFSMGIGETGIVAGYSFVGTRTYTAVLWDGGVLSPLDSPEGTNTISYDINIDETVAGAVFSGSERHVARWFSGTMEDLGTLGGGFGEARGINDPGQITGWSAVANGDYHAFLWEDGMFYDISIPGSDLSGGEDLNNRGQIAGWSLTDGVYSPILWTDGSPLHLPRLGDGASDGASAVNESGQVVGVSETVLGGRRAVLWRPLVPAEVQDLIGLVQQLCSTGVLNNGQCNSLLNKLNIATAMLNDEKPTPAVNKIESFIHEVEAILSGNSPVLSHEQGQPLIDGAWDAINRIEG
jgi:probable HAF family extracellular repeat protein